MAESSERSGMRGRSNSSSSSDDNSSHTLPSVKELVNKFGSLSKAAQSTKIPQSKNTTTKDLSIILKSAAEVKPTTIYLKSSSTSQESQVKSKILPSRYSKNNSNKLRPSQSLTDLHSSNIDDDVFYSDKTDTNHAVDKKRNTFFRKSSDSEIEAPKIELASHPKYKDQIESKPPQSNGMFNPITSTRSQSKIPQQDEDSSKNTIFGVKLRPLTSISWGVKQKRYSSYEYTDKEEQEPVSPSPITKTKTETFNTLPKKTAPLKTDNEFKSNTFTKRTGGGVKSKVMSSKLGDKVRPQYHSQSDLSSAGIGAGTTWRRKSISEDTYEMNKPQPLTRRQSISDLLKLYRTKSQTDLTQISDGQTNFKTNSFQPEEIPPKPIPIPVVAPLKMSDLKINPMSKPKAESYKPATKDIVRLSKTQSMVNWKPPTQAKPDIPPKKFLDKIDSKNIKQPMNSTTGNSYPRPQIFSVPGQHFHKITPVPKPSTVESYSDKVIPTAKSPENKRDDSTMKLTRMLTPTPYSTPSNEKPIVIVSPRHSSKSSVSSSSSVEDHPIKHNPNVITEFRKEASKGRPTQLNIKYESGIISQPLQQNKQEPELPTRKTPNTDDTDGIPHDEKVPSFIISPSLRNNSTDQVSKKAKDLPPKSYPRTTDTKNHYHKGKHSNDDPDGIPHDDKVPSFVVPSADPSPKENKISKNTNEPMMSTQPGSSLKSWSGKTRLNHTSSSSSVSSFDERDNNSIETNRPLETVNWKENAKKILSQEEVLSDSSEEEIRTRQDNSKLPKEREEQNYLPNNRFVRRSSSTSSEEEKSGRTLPPTKVETKKAKKPFSEQNGLSEKNVQRSEPQNKQSKIPQAVQKTTKSHTNSSPLHNKPRSDQATTKPVISGESLPQTVNIRAENKSESKEISSNTEEVKKSPSKIPLVNHNVRKYSSTSEDEVKLSHASKKKNIEPKKGESDSSSLGKGSEAEAFQDFDPYAIGRMIVRGARKSTSVVKRPENLTNIRNASVPKNSPFSPLKDLPPLEAKPQRRSRMFSTSSSSSDDDDQSLLLGGDQDGIYSANVAVTN